MCKKNDKKKNAHDAYASGPQITQTNKQNEKKNEMKGKETEEKAN